MQGLRTFALKYPEAEEGVACKGTAVECLTIKARNKAFLFLGKTNLRLKLGASLAEATKLASNEPARFEVGSGGWIKVNFSADQPPPVEVLIRWIDESYRLLAPKQLIAQLAQPKLAQPNSMQPAAKKKPARKKPTR